MMGSSEKNAISNLDLHFAKICNMPTMQLSSPPLYTFQDAITPEICNLRVPHYELVDKFHKFVNQTHALLPQTLKIMVGIDFDMQPQI
jgi:hypothetical protein